MPRDNKYHRWTKRPVPGIKTSILRRIPGTATRQRHKNISNRVDTNQYQSKWRNPRIIQKIPFTKAYANKQRSKKVLQAEQPHRQKIHTYDRQLKIIDDVERQAYKEGTLTYEQNVFSQKRAAEIKDQRAAELREMARKTKAITSAPVTIKERLGYTKQWTKAKSKTIPKIGTIKKQLPKKLFSPPKSQPLTLGQQASIKPVPKTDPPTTQPQRAPAKISNQKPYITGGPGIIPRTDEQRAQAKKEFEARQSAQKPYYDTLDLSTPQSKGTPIKITPQQKPVITSGPGMIPRTDAQRERARKAQEARDAEWKRLTPKQRAERQRQIDSWGF